MAMQREIPGKPCHSAKLIVAHLLDLSHIYETGDAAEKAAVRFDLDAERERVENLVAIALGASLRDFVEPDPAEQRADIALAAVAPVESLPF